MTDAEGPLTSTRQKSIYALMLLALIASIACSYASAAEHGLAQAELVENFLMFASLGSFVSIGALALVAQRLGRSKAHGAVPAAPLAESHSDRPIVGLRAWRAVPCGGRTLVLQSWHARHALWPRGRELTAEPASTGIHAFKAAAPLLAYVGAEIASARTVVGTVALWGTVIEHEDGWTAERAYPLEIHTADADVAASVRRLYGCEAAVAPDGLTKALGRLESRMPLNAE